MHEAGIALQIVKIAQGAIPADADQARVGKVYLNIGKLSAVVPASLRFCFGFAAQGTRLEGAELVINEIKPLARCRVCGHDWRIEEMAFSCPACGGGGIDVISGRELTVKAIEIKDPVL